MTGNSYPTQEQLDALKLMTEPFSIVSELTDLWNTDNGWIRFSHESRVLELHTGGWSGNEEVIEVLGEMEFWDRYWTKIVRGGHYYFEIT